MNHIKGHLLIFVGCLLLLLNACSSDTVDTEPPAPASPLPTRTSSPTTTRVMPTDPHSTSTATSPTPSPSPTQDPTPGQPEEAKLQILPLVSAFPLDKAEVSGMAWLGDTLLILPQYPEDYRTAGGSANIFTIPKAAILEYLDNPAGSPLEASTMPIINAPPADQIPGYEGYEAIAIDGDRVFLTIEANRRGIMQGYLIAGDAQENGGSITLRPDSLVEIPTPVQIFNSAYETLVAVEGKLLAIFEANGEELNPDPQAVLINTQNNEMRLVQLPSIPFRITDATAADPDQRFWVLNIFMPIEFWFYTNADPLVDRSGLGETHASNNHVERLVEFKYNQGQVQLTGSPPLYMALDPDGSPRNWEAVVRLDERGFLAMTDAIPGTILGFIPFPGK